MKESLSTTEFKQWLHKRKHANSHRQLLILQVERYVEDELEHAATHLQFLNTDLVICIDALISHYPDLLYIGEDPEFAHYGLNNCIKAGGLVSHLGRQYPSVILDCRGGWQPNQLYAASGLVQATGLLILLTPPGLSWPSYYASHHSIRFSHNDNHSYSYFAALMHVQCHRDSTVAWWCSTSAKLPIIIQDESIDDLAISNHITLSEPQKFAFTQVTASWLSKQKSCHLIIGARGRGKSTLLAYIAKFALDKAECAKFEQVIICAPTPAQSEVVKAYLGDRARTDKRLVSIAPDQAQHIQPNALLVIDEAASISPSLLSALCSRVKHVVLSTTSQGYEGSGKGFLYRWLPNYAGNHHLHRLSAPFRWAVNDPLEALMEQLFHATLDKIPTIGDAEIKLFLVNKVDIISRPLLNKACFALLNAAHYQSTPNDLLRMLDADDHHLWIYACGQDTPDPKRVLGVICTISEGGDHIFSDGVDRVDEASELPNLIATGKRRVQGHMSVQALAQHLNMPEILSHRVHRIHRIAVHPDLQRQSHGSDMLKALEARKQSLGIAAFTTAFGLTDPLHQFWQLNHYCLIKIGQRKDTSSAMVTGHYVQRDSPLYRQICDSASEHLQIDLRYLKKYQQSLYAVIPKRIISLASSDSDDGTGECLACERKLKLFATEVISYAMAKSALYSMALKHQSSELTCLINRLHIKHLSKEQKEQITLLLRDGVKTLMDQCNKN